MIKRMVLFCDKQVGLEVAAHVLSTYPKVLKLVVVTDTDRKISSFLAKRGFDRKCILRASTLRKNSDLLADSDLFLLAWWPSILDRDYLSIPRLGTVNLHPSLLPYNRGKHYNFWTLVEDCPFGVSLHFAEEAVDAGDIIAQKAIKKSWEDTGMSLYFRAQQAIVQLLKETLPRLMTGKIGRHPQPSSRGSFHLARELDKASRIELNRPYLARDLLNLLRARTFPPHPACYFYDAGKRYEVTLKITETPSE